MKIEDLDQVMALEHACFSVPWSRDAFEKEICDNALAVYYVVLLDDIVIGYIGIWYIVGEGHITNVAVDPRYRGNGYGKVLVETIKKDALTHSITDLTLEVRISNKPAISLYEKMGFESAGIRPNYYSDNQEDALIMWTSIQ
jgi:ribosomal-protein-alanine N-acetyltransferase